MTNPEMAAYGRQLETERAEKRSVWLLHRMRTIEDDMKLKLETLRELRTEYDQLKAAEALKRQMSFDDQLNLGTK